MASNLNDVKLSPSMRSDQGESSASKRKIPLTLFDDLIENRGDENLNRGDDDHLQPRGEDDSWLSLGLSKVSEDNPVYQGIKRNLESSLDSGGLRVQIGAVYKNGHSSTMGRARSQSFGMYRKAIEEKSGGNANVNCAWYGGSRCEISGILSHGFSLPLNSGLYGRGFYFAAARHPLESLRLARPDSEGVRHMMLCRVIAGKVEVIASGSRQQNRSSEEFDSGVDNLQHPRNFIIWNAKVNTHVLPEHVLSFKTSPSCSGSRSIPGPMAPPNSDWILVATLINGLSNFVPDGARNMLAMYLNDYERHKITRQGMIQRIRVVVGDRLLRTMIESYGEKGKASGSRRDQAPG